MGNPIRTIKSIPENISSGIDSLLESRRLVWAILLTALFLRCLHYFSNPSLWLDEASLALNIIEESFSDLLGPLERGQMAPPGFLLITKLLVELFGSSEYILRFFPFACGIVSVFIFRHIVLRILERKTSTIALGLFAISPYLVHYSAEFKQYGSDVAIALILYAFTIRLLRQNLNSSTLILFFLIGTLSLILSHASAFILTSIGFTLAGFYIKDREFLKLIRLFGIYLIWIVCFLYLVYFFLPDMTSIITKMQEAWKHAFMPLPPSSISDIKWFGLTFSRIVKYPLGFYFPPVTGLVFLAGCVSMFQGKRLWLCLLISPMLIALIVSGFRLYPFDQRMLLYSVPAILIIVVEGIQYLRIKTQHLSPAMGLVLAALVFYGPTAGTAYTLLTGPPYRMHHKEEIRPVLSFIHQNKMEGDLIYVYYASKRAFAYYARDYGLEDMVVVGGKGSRDDWSGYIEDLNKVRGHDRVWVLFSHVWREEKGGQTEKDYILEYLDEIGKRIKMITKSGASVYLYDLLE